MLLATQELSDLERAGRGFRDQVLGLTALKIAHRQDVPASARTLSEIAGTEPAWERTHTVARRSDARPPPRDAPARAPPGGPPDEIGRLGTGQAVVLTRRRLPASSACGSPAGAIRPSRA